MRSAISAVESEGFLLQQRKNTLIVDIQWNGHKYSLQRKYRNQVCTYSAKSRKTGEKSGTPLGEFLSSKHCLERHMSTLAPLFLAKHPDGEERQVIRPNVWGNLLRRYRDPVDLPYRGHGRPGPAVPGAQPVRRAILHPGAGSRRPRGPQDPPAADLPRPQPAPRQRDRGSCARWSPCSPSAWSSLPMPARSVPASASRCWPASSEPLGAARRPPCPFGVIGWPSGVSRSPSPWLQCRFARQPEDCHVFPRSCRACPCPDRVSFRITSPWR